MHLVRPRREPGNVDRAFSGNVLIHVRCPDHETLQGRRPSQIPSKLQASIPVHVDSYALKEVDVAAVPAIVAHACESRIRETAKPFERNLTVDVSAGVPNTTPPRIPNQSLNL